MQNEGQNNLYRVIPDYIPSRPLSKKNGSRSWLYGYNEEYDFVNISKTGQVGEIVEISGLRIGLPPAPKDCHKRHNAKSQQYWERQEFPKELQKINSIFQWNEMPSPFKDRWVDYIESEFDRREEGHWFMNHGDPTYITGSHYMYLQWTSIDVGYPDYREANRIFFIFWEASKADINQYRS